MKLKLLAALMLLWAPPLNATESCDFQHQCYHMDPTDPNKITPPPAPMYPPVVVPHPQVQISQEHACHIVLMRHSPNEAFQAVEICTLTPEKEAMIRRQIQ